MANKKKTNKQARAWVVVGTNGGIGSFPTQLSAFKKAKENKIFNEETEWYVFEVAKSWLIDMGEPRVEEIELEFGELP